jgi:hypothetical protein
MAIPLNVKDSNRLETLRVLKETDPAFYDTLNRPHVDLEQRTNDVDRIFTPARGLRVRQEIPASDSIEVESGIVIGTDGTTLTQTTLQTIGPVTPTAASQIRADLIYFNTATQVAVRLAGVPVGIGSGFSSALWPDLPALPGAIPLGILYVGENIGTTVDFDETLTGDVEGQVIDIRPAIGTSRLIFEDSAPGILSDTTSGSVGTGAKVVRSNHRHPLNVDATTPETLGADIAGAVGGAATYARRNHKHSITVETNNGAVLSDAAAASAGSAGQFVRSDHRHPKNVPTSGVPAGLGTNFSPTHGVLSTYSPSDHIHNLPVLETQIDWSTWTASGGARNFTFTFVPDCIIVLIQVAGTQIGDAPCTSVGFATGVSDQYSIGWSVDTGGSTNRMGAGGRRDSIGVIAKRGEQPGGTGLDTVWGRFTMTNFGTTVTIDPDIAVTGHAFVLAIAQGEA